MAATSLASAYGGPAYTVLRLAESLAERGCEIGLWSSDDSDPAPRRRPSLSLLRGSARRAFETFNPDILHDNGLWRPHNHALARIAAGKGVARVVSTRGMLEPWAFAHKRWKKSIAWYAYQRTDLNSATAIHATSQREASNLERLNLEPRVFVVPNGIDIPGSQAGTSDREGSSAGSLPRVALFLGRFSPVKGLPLLVEAWHRVRPAGWLLQLSGPDENNHAREIEKLVRTRKLGDSVSITGPVTGDAKAETFRRAELVVLPSFSESFGVTVAEALSHGRAVLTTTGTPWHFIEERQLGWVCEASVESLVEKLRLVTGLDSASLAKAGARGRDYATRELSWTRLADALHAEYAGILNSDEGRKR